MERLTFGGRLRHAWNVFRNKDPSDSYAYGSTGASYSVRPDRPFLYLGSSKAILTPIYNRIAIDVANLVFREVIVDENDKYKKVVKSGLTECLTVAANIDQTARMFKQECCLNLFEEGVIAIVPTKTDIDPTENGGYKIEELRVGSIVEWFPKDIRVRLYNDETGLKEEIEIPKKIAAIVENPYYAIMNDANTVIQGVMSKFKYLDKVNSQTTSGKLNLLIQFPYSVNSDKKRALAETRVKEVETQMSTSDHGIAYIGATDKVIQLNRSIENNFMQQITDMMNILYSQLGITESIMNGTASEEEMLNYYNRTVEPVAEAIAGEMNRKFLTKTARTQGHTIKYFRDPFKLVPVERLAEISDKLTRNEILSPNEVRSIIGYKPVEDPKADELRNRNLNVEEGHEPVMTSPEEGEE